MTPAQEARNHRRLYSGKVIPKPVPAPPPNPTTPYPPDYHPERRTDPHYAWKKFRRGGYVAFLRQSGFLIESRLTTHFARASRSYPGTTDHALTTSLATGVETPGAPAQPARVNLESVSSLVSQPQAPKSRLSTRARGT